MVKEEAKTKRKGTRIRAGHVFEDATAQRVYLQARDLGLRPNPPRYTLDYPTLSGNTYQFDGSFTHQDTVYVIECKRTRMAAKEYIYYFNSKILDYVFGAMIRKKTLPIKGIFLSTVEVGDSSMVYAMAYGIIVIDPESPPLEHMLSTSREGTALHRAINDLLRRMPDLSVIFKVNQIGFDSAADLYRNYRFLCKRWRDECETRGEAP